MIIDIHGLTVRCEAENSDLATAMVRPFKFFVRHQAECAFTVVVREEDLPYDRLPPMEAQFSTPRNVVYRDPKLKVVDYFGKGAIVQESGSTTYTLYSRDRNLIREAFYLLVLSLFGQFCDRHGMLRIHALAVSCNGKALILMIPQGGGKSTLALNLLEQDQVKLISDDDPIVAPDGSILPFPRSLGVLGADGLRNIPSRYVYSVDRMEFGTKYFVDLDYWEGKVEREPVGKSVLFVTRRVMNGPPGIERTSRRAALGGLMRDAVFGVGLYQGVEFLFNHSTWEAVSKGTLVLRRFVRAARLASASETYRFTLSSDIAMNGRVLQDFIRNLR